MDVHNDTFANTIRINEAILKMILKPIKKISNKSLNIKTNHGTLTISYHDHNQSDFITTDEYENVQDEKEEVKSNSI